MKSTKNKTSSKKAKITSPFIHHIVITIGNFERSLRFYEKVLGKPVFHDGGQFMYEVGKTQIFFALPLGNPLKGDFFSPNRIGLDHLAFGIKSLTELQKLAIHLDKQDILHSGIQTDKDSGREKIWLNDPDGIRLEFFL